MMVNLYQCYSTMYNIPVMPIKYFSDQEKKKLKRNRKVEHNFITDK